MFHVQTEDSGLLNPHLFTHLFHGGVIVSTRKLVYDSGANEEAIKSLMQAQHKAVMKDLRKGAFDDKIDQYLSGTPGLEPREGSGPPARPTDPDLAAPAETPAPAPAAAAPPPPAPPPAKPISEELSRPPTTLELEAQTVFSPGIPSFDIGPPESVPILLTQKTARTTTADRLAGTAPTRLNVATPPGMPPPPSLEEAPTLAGPSANAVAAAVQAAKATAPARAATPPPIPGKALPQDFRIDSNPEIEISVGTDPGRGGRDTAVEVPFDPTVPTTIPDSAGIRRGESGPVAARRSPTGDRPASLVGATLPPAPKPPQRPGFSPPAAIARPAAPPEPRVRDTDATELYVPSQQGEPERPGQYSVGRGKPPSDNIPMLRDKGGGRPPLSSSNLPRQGQPTPVSGHQKVPTGQNVPLVPPRAANNRTPAVATPVVPREPAAPRPVPPARQGTTPIANRSAPSNVVMTRPAVVVGGPPKPATPATPPRVRKAREDEGRGFGQGLISEKSLDEVILAYLSEDAEDK